MKTIKDIEKEFDKYFEVYADENHEWIERPLERHHKFLKIIANQIIDDMIGEEKIYGVDFQEDNRNSLDLCDGYNQKVKELRDFKKKFNE